MNAYDTIIFLFLAALGSFVTKSLESYMLGKVVIKAHVCPTLSLCVGIGKHNRSVSGSARRLLTNLAWRIHLHAG